MAAPRLRRRPRKGLILMKVVTHPDNLELLKQLCETDAFGGVGLFPIEIVTNRHMDRTKPTGRYILPDGRKVKLAELRVTQGRFVEWGPQDIKVLLWWGIVREEREPLFYKLGEEFLRFEFLAVPTFKTPKYILTAGI